MHVRLPSGRIVNIATTPGADTFIRESGQFLSTGIRLINQSRNTLSNSREQREGIKKEYILFSLVAQHASPEVFSTIPKRELDCLVEHAKQVFSQLAENDRWTKTGVLDDYNQSLLTVLVCNMRAHITFGKKALDMGLMHVLAHFYGAHGMPGPDVTKAFLDVVNNYFARMWLDKQKNEEKIMKRLEATGILAQYIRGITQTPRLDLEKETYLTILDTLMSCSSLIRKKFKVGEPSGDVLRRVIDKEDGYRGERDERVTVRLQNLAKMAGLFNAKYAPDGTTRVKRSCNNCNKTEGENGLEKLSECSRCKVACYCSKECQRAHWKIHKKLCAPGESRHRNSMKDNVVEYVRENYDYIMKQFVKVAQEQNATMKELVLELDFCAQDGSAPALRSPPEFTVGVTRRYFEGSRLAELDWFRNQIGRDDYKDFSVKIRSEYEARLSECLLTISRSPKGLALVSTVELMTADNRRSLFSDEALDAFSHAMNGDDSHLVQFFGQNLASTVGFRQDTQSES